MFDQVSCWVSPETRSIFRQWPLAALLKQRSDVSPGSDWLVPLLHTILSWLHVSHSVPSNIRSLMWRVLAERVKLLSVESYSIPSQANERSFVFCTQLTLKQHKTRMTAKGFICVITKSPKTAFWTDHPVKHFRACSYGRSYLIEYLSFFLLILLICNQAISFKLI